MNNILARMATAAGTHDRPLDESMDIGELPIPSNFDSGLSSILADSSSSRLLDNAEVSDLFQEEKKQ